MTAVSDPHVTEKYLAELDTVLVTLFAKRTHDLLELVRGAQGAFPSLVIERLQSLGLSWTLRSVDASPEDESSPELHPLDFEWHYTKETVKQLAELVGDRGVNLIGLPNVAGALKPGFTLIDRNPFAVLRNRSLPKLGSVVITDIRDVTEGSLEPREVVAFDPPWYVGEVQLWLARAAMLAAPDAEIIFTLFPPMLRPSAKAERESILELAAMVGDVDILPGALSYVTPRFEAEALDAAGVPTLKRWRRGDLVRVRTERSRSLQLPLLSEPVERPCFETFRIDTQVVKLRKGSEASTERPPIEQVPGVGGWRYPTVSARDHLRSRIDVWTSRNRIGTVRDFTKVRRWLAQLDTVSSHSRTNRRLQSGTLAARRVVDGYARNGDGDEARVLRELLDL